MSDMEATGALEVHPLPLRRYRRRRALSVSNCSPLGPGCPARTAYELESHRRVAGSLVVNCLHVRRA